MSNSSRIADKIYLLIISRLPVRSVLTCKCVCNSWLNLISTPDFVEMHLNFHRENSSSLMLGGKQEDKSDVIYSIGYHSLASSLLTQIGDNNKNNDVGYEASNTSVEMEPLSSRSSEIKMDSLASSSSLNPSGIVRMDYPFKYLGRITNKVYTEVQILRNKNSMLEARNAELEASHAEVEASHAVLEARNAQLVASYVDLQRELHKCQVAYKHLEQCVDVQ
ncbi:hypothetical protein MKX01_035903, partial [Papaver californicum]